MTISEEKELFKVGMKGIVVKIYTGLPEEYKRLGFEIGTIITITHVSDLCILKCENDQGEWMPFLPSEILITKIK